MTPIDMIPQAVISPAIEGQTAQDELEWLPLEIAQSEAGLFLMDCVVKYSNTPHPASTGAALIGDFMESDSRADVTQEMLSAGRDVLISAHDSFALVCQISEADLAAVYTAMRALEGRDSARASRKSPSGVLPLVLGGSSGFMSVSSDRVGVETLDQAHLELCTCLLVASGRSGQKALWGVARLQRSGGPRDLAPNPEIVPVKAGELFALASSIAYLGVRAIVARARIALRIRRYPPAKQSLESQR